MHLITSFLRDESGLTIVEYAVAGGVVAIVGIGAFIALGGSVDSRVGDMTTAVVQARPDGG